MRRVKMSEATSHHGVNRDNFNSESSRPQFAASLMVLGRAPNVQDAEIWCGLLLNDFVSYCRYHCTIYIYIYIVIHKSVKHFKNLHQINYPNDHGSSYADRERNFPSFFYIFHRCSICPPLVIRQTSMR